MTASTDHRQRHRASRSWLWVLGVAVAAALGLLIVVSGHIGRPAAVIDYTETEAWSSGSFDPPEAIRISCSACHPFPPPDILPRAAWAQELQQMAEVAEQRGIEMQAPEDEILRWYQSHAPETLADVVDRGARPGPIRWRRRSWRPIGLPRERAVTHRRFVDLLGGPAPDLVICEVRHSLVMALRMYDPQAEPLVLARLRAPCHVEPCDLDADGLTDLVVADLGVFAPTDATEGRVVWLRRTGPTGFDTVVLADGLGRVADVRPADLDGDGDVDLVVAVFGWRNVGHVMWMENIGSDEGGAPRFERHVLDARPGAIHVPVVDIDGDGDLDILAVISQEHEQVVAYLREADGFRTATLYAAPHPDWGYTGMQVVDFDGDGDPDILLSNGDILDNGLLKPYHGVALLENLGGLRFEHRWLTTMYGVYRAVAADLDGDGDLDVAAGAFLPHFADDSGIAPSPHRAEGLIWLERVGPTQLVRHVLSPERPQHASIAVADADGDGDLDLATGDSEPLRRGALVESANWITLWENRARENSGEP